MNGPRGRNSSPSRGVGRTRSGDMAGMQRNGPPVRRGSPSRGVARSRSDDLAMMHHTTARGRSISPSRNGVGRAKSGDLVSMQRAIHRGRSGSPSRFVKPKSQGAMQDATRNRSSSPSRMRGRSNSPSRSLARGRGRSSSPSQQRARSASRSGDPSRSRSRSRDELNGRIRKGGRRPQGPGKLRKGFSKRFIAVKEDWSILKILSYVIPVIIILASIGGLIVATGNGDKIKPTFLTRLGNDEVVDPFAKSTGTATDGVAARWENDGQSGLTIEVLNAMNSKWDVFFNLAVADWDYGNPDALSITTESIQEDKACKPLDGKIKVCNGDYGETKWRGISSATYDKAGYILSSAAQMNEFYLDQDGDDAKQYTLCHEMGHGFGLAHTDETFGNPDLGNCLDYTDNFAVNKHPDVSNYNTLLGMYGAVGGGRQRRLLRHYGSRTRSDSETPDEFWNKVHDSVQKLSSRLDDKAHEDGWKLLHRSRHGEEHELELGEGYKVRVHMLLANKDN